MKYNHEPCCCVTSNECEAPANYDGPLEHRLLRCYVCGLPVCRACSNKMLDYQRRHPPRPVRVCDNCLDENSGRFRPIGYGHGGRGS